MRIIYRTYMLRFIAEGHGTDMIRQCQWGDGAFSIAPLTAAAYIASLADSHRTGEPSRKEGPHYIDRLVSTVEGGFETLRAWMGEAMWADFLTISSPN